MLLQPKYACSHALVIGINRYKTASPLGYAVSDAEAVAEALTEKFSFPKNNVHLLLNEHATRDAIMERFLSFADNGCAADDRIVVFYAGHGHTVRSNRGEVGYLVPWEGDPSKRASLIRWDTLTRDADLIEAKHILFIMDACYGGLAITRALKPGTMRFMKDMLQRRSRQVLTAGKADELVADLGGPLPNHSVFTGHFLEALSGKAAGEKGILTANGVIAYVYHQVANDAGSEQTPHFGYLSGDGDLIFNDDILAAETPPDADDPLIPEKDVLSAIPGVLMPGEREEQVSAVQQAKDLLAEARLRIKLHDYVTLKTREVIEATDESHFAAQGRWSPEEFAQRLEAYEVMVRDIAQIQGLLGFWSEPYHRGIIRIAPERLAGRLGPSPGLSVWLSLRYYPLLLMMYCGGIGALAASNYGNLRDLLLTPVRQPNHINERVPLLLAVGKQMNEIHDAFKALPGHDSQYTPRSEYLLKRLQPVVDDALFLGGEYEALFDRFEVLYALEYANQNFTEDSGRVWGPVGRFGWKGRRGGGGPLQIVLDEAERDGSSWAPLVAGLFGRSVERFKVISQGYVRLLGRLPWY